MPITETAIKRAKARAHTYRLSDGRGFTLLVQKNGAKLWRLRYQFDGREGNLSLGQYSDTAPALARDKRDEARKLIAAGVNASELRKEENARRGNTFKIAAAGSPRPSKVSRNRGIPLIMDESVEWFRAFDVMRVPTVVIADGRGKIVWRGEGFDAGLANEIARASAR